MMQSRTFLWAISLSLVAVGVGCGGDDTTITKTTSSSSSSGSSGGEGGMGTGGMGTGGMGTTSSSSSSSSSSNSSSSSSSSSGSSSSSSSSSSSGSSSSSSSSSSSGSGGPTCNPEGPFDGAPVTAMANKWTWVGVPEAKCRNGSSTGFGVRINPNSTKLVIYFQGGGACFNGLTCGTNPSSYGSNNFGNGPSGGLFDSGNAANELRDWNFVYIPYCTGDVHGGNNTAVDVPGAGGPKNQSFVGYANVGFDLKRIVPTFPNVTQVLVTGESAGGFGAFYNYDRIAQAFCPTPVDLIDDSGPPMSDTYMAPCLQQRWRTLYNFNATLPKDCVDCSLPNGGGFVNTWKLLGEKYPDRNLGVISSDKDNTISTFYGFGKNNCQNIDGFIPSPLSGAEYTAGLLEVRDMFLKPSPAWSSYFINSTQHTWIGGGSYYSSMVMGVSMSSWVGGIVNGAAAVHVGP